MDKVHLTLIITAALSYLLSLIFAYLNTAKASGLYYSSNGDVDDKYYQQASPKGISFAIVWPIIYLWNLAGMMYILISLCLAEKKSPVKLQPTLISKTFLISYSLGFIATVGWLFAFDREILSLSLVLLIIAVGAIYSAVGTSCKLVHDNSSKFGSESKDNHDRKLSIFPSSGPTTKRRRKLLINFFSTQFLQNF